MPSCDQPARSTYFNGPLYDKMAEDLRLNETLHLQIGDIDSLRTMVHVHRGKEAKDRYVPVGRDVKRLLVRTLYADIRPDRTDARAGAVIVHDPIPVESRHEHRRGIVGRESTG